ncbi:MAG: diacylglycerol kinase family protein [Pyrinomonadaceae bacterium]
MRSSKKFSSSDSTLPLIIVNPKSASGATRDKWSLTASELRAHFGPFSVAFTKSQGDGVTIAHRSARDGRKFIIACGGDGTINEVANGIIQSGKDVELGVLPSGTGGDLRRTLGLPLSNREAAVALRDGETRWMDAGRVTFQDHDGETVSRYFLNISSVGLAASVIKRVKGSRIFDWVPMVGVRGKANFAMSALQEVIGPDAATVRIRIDDGDEKTIQTLCLCIANSRFFGGGMMIAPDAKINDGLLDIINVGDMSTAKIILNAYSLYKGTHLSINEVKSTLAKKIEVSAVDPSHEILLETDGEMPGKLPATYEVVPNAIRVRVPSSNL